VRIIVNPAAAGGRVAREWSQRVSQVRSLGLDGEVVHTRAAGHATELASQAVAAGETVVAVGGDGTFCEVAEGMHRAGGGIVAFLPMGTGNDTARSLGIPVRFEQAVQVAAAGVPRAIDLIQVGERVVVNAIGVGLTGDINRRAARVKVVRGIAAYLATALVSLVRYRSPRVHLRWPEGSCRSSMSILAVHGGPTTGGGFCLTPAARLDDGRLDVCLVPGLAPPLRLARLVAALRGRLGQTRGTLELQAPELDLEFDEPLPAHLDGNQTLLMPPAVRFEVLPGALQVVAPCQPAAAAGV
jgi:YegS/Rv2252/BmrU family lipid kinase